MRDGKLFILSAPSGAGKTTLAKVLVERMPDTLFSVSHTTRKRRPGERHGIDYYFVSDKEFKAMVAADRFLEHAEVFGNHYGTAKETVSKLLAEGKNVILDIDWQGARDIRSRMPDTRSIFVLPPTGAELATRLRERGQDSEPVIRRRMRDAADEIRHYDEYDYVVVNDDLEQAVHDLEAIFCGRPESVRQFDVDVQELINECEPDASVEGI